MIGEPPWSLRAGHALAALAVLALGLAAPRSGASAQDALTLRLVRQTVEAAPGETFEVVLTAAGVTLPADGELAVTLHGRFEAPRDELDAMLFAGTPPTVPTSFFAIPLAEVPRGDAGQLALSVPVVGRGEDRPERGFRLSNPGIYPVLLEIRGPDDDVLASMLTVVARPRTEEGADRRFPVGFVLRHTAPPALQPDGSVRLDPTDQDQLATIADLLARRPDLPLTVGLPPELLAALSGSGLAGAGSVVGALSESIGGRELLATTFVTMDPTASATSGLTPTFTSQLTEGEESLTTTLQAAGTSRAEWFHDAPLGAEGMELLRLLGVRNLVLPYEAVQPVDDDARLDINRPVRLQAGADATVHAGIIDPGVQAMLTDPGDDPVLSAHLAVARLLASDFAWSIDDPQPHGALVGPRVAAPLDRLALGTFVDLLATTPTLQPVSLEDWFGAVTPNPDDGSAVELTPDDPENLAPLALRLATTSSQIDDVAGMAVERPELDEQLQSLMERAVADELDNASRDAYFTAVDGQLGAITGSVLPVEVERITMTDRTATLPITIRTTTDEPLRMRVRMRSAKFEFPEGDQLVTVARESRLEVPVAARSNGTFAVAVDLVTPTQERPLVSPTQVQVTAASFTGLGIAITIVAALILAAWWVHHVRRARTRQRAELETAADHPGADTGEVRTSE